MCTIQTVTKVKRTFEIWTFTLQEWQNKEVTAYVTYFSVLTSLTFNIFILCYIGELIAEQV